jgi:hypothetical protein
MLTDRRKDMTKLLGGGGGFASVRRRLNMLLKYTVSINVFHKICRAPDGEFSHFLDNFLTLIVPSVFGH